MIDAVDWVNVIALTPDDLLVLVEQYRHGTNTVELEIPGGMVDRGDASPVVAGVRELREETGYEGENARILGKIFPNPAIQSNTCFTVLVENCRPKHALEFDHGEGVYFWDRQGRRYLDFMSQLFHCNLGHGNRRVIEAIREQASRSCCTRRVCVSTQAWIFT